MKAVAILVSPGTCEHLKAILINFVILISHKKQVIHLLTYHGFTFGVNLKMALTLHVAPTIIWSHNTCNL